MRIATIGLCDPGYSENTAKAQYAANLEHFRSSKLFEIVDAGLQSDEFASGTAIDSLRQQHGTKPLDVLVLMQVAWARPAILLQVIRTFSKLPMVLCSPGSEIVNGAIKSIAPAAGAASTFPILQRHGIKLKFVWSSPGKPIDISKIVPFIKAAQAVNRLKGAKLGMVGFGDMRLQTTGFDVREIHENFGVEIESIDMLELKNGIDRLSPQELEQCNPISNWTYVGQKPSHDLMRKILGSYIILDKLAAERGYVGLSIKCPTGAASVMGFTPCLVGTLLANKYHYVCENDIPGLLTQVILGLLSDKMSAYWELYEIFDDSLLLGCCGFCPETFTVKPYKIRTLEGFLTGAACCSQVKTGDYTIARLGQQSSSSFVLQAIEGKAEPPPAWYEEACGTAQHPSVKFMPDCSIEQLVNGLLAQHFAVVPGLCEKEISEFKYLTNLG